MGLLLKVYGETPARPARRPLEGSPQQEAFWAELTSGGGHVLLEARAGTGKSTSCAEGIWRLREEVPGIRCVYVAFNRSIADEFQAKLPPGASASTMHSLGFAALRRAFPSIGEPSRFKLNDLAGRHFKGRDGRSKKCRNAVARLAGLCKGHLLSGEDPASLVRLASRHGVDLPAGDRAAICDAVPRVIAASLAQTNLVDFADMIWMPVMLGLEFPPVDVLFVDEAQDLDPCQHALVRLVAGEGSMVVVGDRHQAIYGFRGADCDSLETLAGHMAGDACGLTRLPLTVTRRCPRSHVGLAQAIVPDLEAMPGAPGGRIDEGPTDDSGFCQGLLVLCRTNAPLVAACLSAAAAGVPVAIQGRDLGDGLAKFVEGFEVGSIEELSFAVQDYRARQLAILAELDDAQAEIEQLQDRIACIMALAARCDSVGELVARIRALFLDVRGADAARVCLFSSIHRAKGGEADHVVILRPDLLPHPMARDGREYRQELNLAYVAATRSKRRLSFNGEIPFILKGARSWDAS